MNILELKGVSSGYTRSNVVIDVSLTVPTCSVVAIVGPNGHGKTTLLRAISGLLKLRSGNIVFDGRSISNRRPEEIARSGLSHVPQGDLLFSQMSVYENLLMGAYCEDKPSVVASRLELVFKLFPNLRELRAQTTSSLSGGERRMAGLGRGFMADAKLMLIDEPSLGLAPLIIDQVYEAIGAMRAAGKSILLVEENPERASLIADYIYLFDRGAIAWQGPPGQLLSSRKILSTYLGM